MLGRSLREQIRPSERNLHRRFAHGVIIFELPLLQVTG
jgi:hypothetical protein